MNTTTETMQHQPAREAGLKWVASGSVMEAFGAFAAMALAIVGLAGVFSPTMAAIATIIIGAAILIESGSFGAAAFAARTETAAGTTVAEMSDDKSAQCLGGIAGIVLGILALLGVAPLTLLSVAVLVYGVTFLISSAAGAQVSRFTGYPQGLARETTTTHAGYSAQFLVGLGTLVLGILAVIGLEPLTLVLVALLSLGTTALLSGSVLGARSPAFAHR
jgi:hypothetical protein